MVSATYKTLQRVAAAAVAVWPALALAQSAVGPIDLGVISGTYEQAITDTVYTSDVSPPSNPSYPYNFTDAYTFTVNAPFSFSALAASLDVSTVYDITNLQIGLFAGTTMTDYLGNQQTGPGQFDNFTGSASGAVSGLGWTGGGSFVSIASGSPVAAGTYTLEIRGDITGSVWGEYVGQVGITSAVPEVSSGEMMFAGLGFLALFTRLRRR
jgi:hypothetical protein